jgi:hypothetical protein
MTSSRQSARAVSSHSAAVSDFCGDVHHAVHNVPLARLVCLPMDSGGLERLVIRLLRWATVSPVVAKRRMGCISRSPLTTRHGRWQPKRAALLSILIVHLRGLKRDTNSPIVVLLFDSEAVVSG